MQISNRLPWGHIWLAVKFESTLGGRKRRKEGFSLYWNWRMSIEQWMAKYGRGIMAWHCVLDEQCWNIADWGGKGQNGCWSIWWGGFMAPQWPKCPNFPPTAQYSPFSLEIDGPPKMCREWSQNVNSSSLPSNSYVNVRFGQPKSPITPFMAS